MRMANEEMSRLIFLAELCVIRGEVQTSILDFART